MRATLAFDLPEERSDFLTAANAAALASLLEDIDNEIRSHLKHGADLDLENLRAEIGDVLARAGWRE